MISVDFTPESLSFLEGLLDAFVETEDFKKAPGMFRRSISNGIDNIKVSIEQAKKRQS